MFRFRKAVCVAAALFMLTISSRAQVDSEIAQRPSANVTGTNGTITTVAGNGTPGYSGDGGKATAAELAVARSVTVDASGNYYIADYGACTIRKVAVTDGTINTIAGSAPAPDQNCGYTGDAGPATKATLRNPLDVRLDSVGNIYIADTYNHVVRKVTAATGNISTIAGNGTLGYSGDDGIATAAELGWPSGLAFDAAGNLYIADSAENVIRIVYAATGKIGTFAGTGKANYSGDGGPASAATLKASSFLAFSPDFANLYVADTGNSVIRKIIMKTGIISTVAGTGNYATSYLGDGKPATGQNLQFPYGVAIDSANNLIFCDEGMNAVFEVLASNGNIQVIAGKPFGTSFVKDGGPATAGALFLPFSVGLDKTGNLFFANTGSYSIRKVSFPATSLTTANPTFSPATGTYPTTQSVTITDTTAGAVIHYTTDGTTPTATSPQYGGAIPVTDNTTIKAFALAPGYKQSALVAAKYVIQAAAPTFTPAAGSYLPPVNVTLSDTTSGAVIHYTTDGTTPTAASKVYSAPIPVTVTTTVKAIAIAANFGNSLVASATYTIYVGTTATPVISPSAGTYGTAQSVTLTDTTPGAVMYYTTDGTTPTAASTKYTVPVNVASSLTLNAIAIAPHYAPSLIAWAPYIIAGTPTALNAPATAITTTGATLNAFVSPLGVAGTYFFAYGNGNSVANLTSLTASTPLTATSARLAVSAALTGKLKTKTQYYYQIVVSTVGGTSASAILNFTTK